MLHINTNTRAIGALGTVGGAGSPHRHNSRGFTLIELLIVLAIIALLVSILYPAIGNGISAAKELQCRSNLKTQANAFFSLTTDMEGYLLNYGAEGRGPYMTFLQEGYLEQGDSLYCPEAPKVAGRNGWGGRNFAWKYRNTWSSYIFNGWLHWSGPDKQNPGRDTQIWGALKWEWHWGMGLGSVEATSDVPLFADGYWIDTWPIKTQAPPTSGKESENRTGNHGKFLHRAVTDRHKDDRQNVVFVDGHAAVVKFEDMNSLVWSRQYLTP